MKRQRRLAALMICFLTCTSSAPSALARPVDHMAGSQSEAAPQLIPRSQEQREKAYQSLHHLSLYVQVSNAAGEPVTSLERKDFTLLVNAEPREVTRFQSIQHAASAPTANVILVLDGVNNPTEKLHHFRQGIEEFLKSGSGPLDQQVSIATVSAAGASISPPSRDRSVVLGVVRAQQFPQGLGDCADSANSNGRYLPGRIAGGVLSPTDSPVDPNTQLDCLDHRFNASVRALNSLASRQSNDPARVSLIWIGEGWPLLSVGNYKPDTPSIKQSFFRDLVTISSGMMEQHATLNAIASPDSEPLNAHDKAFFDGVPNEKEVTAASLSLHALSHQSGGQVRKKTKDLPGEISACIADLASYYLLEFDSPPGSVAGEYHSIKVEVGKPDLHVRTSTLYYAGD
jgi:VWFA-related protein